MCPLKFQKDLQRFRNCRKLADNLSEGLEFRVLGR